MDEGTLGNSIAYTCPYCGRSGTIFFPCPAGAFRFAELKEGRYNAPDMFHTLHVLLTETIELANLVRQVMILVELQALQSALMGDMETAQSLRLREVGLYLRWAQLSKRIHKLLS